MATVYLIPTTIAEGKLETLPAYILPAIKLCSVLFVENERSARRFLKSLDRSIEISDYEWHTIHKAEEEVSGNFRQAVKAGKSIGIISESGSPGIADPGQYLIRVAQEMQATIKPLTGPSSILLALMASGMNGQQFEFVGYLPVDAHERKKVLQQLEADSARKKSTVIFIETPYRNNALVQTILETCRPQTLFCIAFDVTGDTESIITKSIREWKIKKPELAKTPAIFLLYAGA